MNHNRLCQALGVLVILSAILACALPSQATQLAPVITPGARETSIASTVQAALQQTADASSVATAAPVNMTGTTIEQVGDGTVKYNDFEAGFEITFPVGWLAMRPNSEEFNAALAQDGAANSMLQDQMNADQAGYEAGYDRIYAYILRPDLQKNSLFGFSKLVWDSNDTVPIDSVTMGKLVQELEASGVIPGFRASTVQLHEGNPIQMIEIGGRWAMSDGQGGTIPFYSTILFFKPSPTSGVRITFTYLQDYREQIAADIKSIMESIRLIGP